MNRMFLNFLKNPIIFGSICIVFLETVTMIEARAVSPITKLKKSVEIERRDVAITDRSWWIPKRVPEYLTYNVTNDNNNNTKNITEEAQVSNKESHLNSTNESATEVKNCSTNGDNSRNKQQQLLLDSSKDFLLFSKYQQPEPTYPDGIRFPATVPISRNKFGSFIKPRFDNNQYLRNSLLRWMNAH